MPKDIAKTVWDDLTVKQRGCDHIMWRGNLFDPDKKSGVCTNCNITRPQYDQHKKETDSEYGTPFWRWKPDYRERMGIKDDYDHTPLS